ncbi:MAG TPA: DUF6448 family protein [Vicinamibacterales bacterium]
MSMPWPAKSLPLLILALTIGLLWPARALAHCDGLDGPVVKSARAALEARNLALVAVWVQRSDEPEIRRVFEQTLVVRALSPEAKELADRFFFETVVRVHRAGEGAPYTGLKPAGRDLGPAIPAADKALDTRLLEPLEKLLTDTLRDRLREHFNEAVTARAYDAADIAAGRDYVRAYVEFIHYVERLYETSTTGAHGHFEGIK